MVYPFSERVLINIFCALTFVFVDQEMVGFPFAVALMIIGALRSGEVATIEYLLPDF